MAAAVLCAPNRFQIDRISRPEPEGRAVRVRLEGCGVCGSNLPAWEGRLWFKYPFPPGQPGHEGWGIVDAVGPEVATVKPGDRVAVLAYQSYAEYDLAPEEYLVPLSGALSAKPFPGEALGCAWNVFRRSGIEPGQTVAIVGIGFLGALLTQFAAHSGAKVLALARRPIALEMARRLGATETLMIQDPAQAVGLVRECTGGTGCDCVIEAAGVQSTLDLAAELTRERGRLVIAGYHQDGLRQINLQLWNWRGLDVINAHERDWRIYIQGMRSAAEAVERGLLDPTPLYTHQFPLDKIAQALDCMRSRPPDFMKAIVTL